jgi:hypothetical protein
MRNEKETGKDTDKKTARTRPEGTFARRITQARFSLAWEALWPVLWPPLGIVGLFIGCALLDVFSYVPGWLHTLSLLGLAGLLGYTLYTGARSLTWPNRRDAVRRIERASGLAHRPLEALQDKLPEGMTDPTSRALWQAHQRQMAERIRSLKVGAPSPGLPARDPWALRAAVVLLLFISVVVAGLDAGDRMGRALSPSFGEESRTQTAKLEIWLTPPEYTRLPPIFPIQVAQDHAKALEQAAAAQPGGCRSAEGGRTGHRSAAGQRVDDNRLGRCGQGRSGHRWHENAARGPGSREPPASTAAGERRPPVGRA